MARRWLRRCKQLLGDLMEKTRYWRLKKEELVRPRWRTCFGRVYGHEVRQTVKWMNILCTQFYHRSNLIGYVYTVYAWDTVFEAWQCFSYAGRDFVCSHNLSWGVSKCCLRCITTSTGLSFILTFLFCFTYTWTYIYPAFEIAEFNKLQHIWRVDEEDKLIM